MLNDNLLMIERGSATVVNERVSQVDYAPWIVWKRWVGFLDAFLSSFYAVRLHSHVMEKFDQIRILSVRMRSRRPKNDRRTQDKVREVK